MRVFIVNLNLTFRQLWWWSKYPVNSELEGDRTWWRGPAARGARGLGRGQWAGQGNHCRVEEVGHVNCPFEGLVVQDSRGFGVKGSGPRGWSPWVHHTAEHVKMSEVGTCGGICLNGTTKNHRLMCPNCIPSIFPNLWICLNFIPSIFSNFWNVLCNVIASFFFLFFLSWNLNSYIIGY